MRCLLRPRRQAAFADRSIALEHAVALRPSGINGTSGMVPGARGAAMGVIIGAAERVGALGRRGAAPARQESGYRRPGASGSPCQELLATTAGAPRPGAG